MIGKDNIDRSPILDLNFLNLSKGLRNYDDVVETSIKIKENETQIDNTFLLKNNENLPNPSTHLPPLITIKKFKLPNPNQKLILNNLSLQTNVVNIEIAPIP